MEDSILIFGWVLLGWVRVYRHPYSISSSWCLNACVPYCIMHIVCEKLGRTVLSQDHDLILVLGVRVIRKCLVYAVKLAVELCINTWWHTESQPCIWWFKYKKIKEIIIVFFKSRVNFLKVKWWGFDSKVIICLFNFPKMLYFLQPLYWDMEILSISAWSYCGLLYVLLWQWTIQTQAVINYIGKIVPTWNVSFTL